MQKGKRENNMNTKQKCRVRKGKYKINKGRLLLLLTVLCLIVSLVHFAFDAFKYPEEHSSIARYHLNIDLANGNQDAIQYYNTRYVANGKYLFGDEYIVEITKSDFLDMATVVGYDVTETGVYLHTNDGNGYFIEK